MANLAKYTKVADRVYMFGHILCGLALLCLFMAFCSPYWIEQREVEGTKRHFSKAGLWQFCLHDWVFAQDYMGKEYTGCWYVFAKEYDYIRAFITPPWFITVQFFASLTLLLLGIAFLMQCMYKCGKCPGSVRTSAILLFVCTWFITVQFLASVTLLILGIAFLIQCLYKCGMCPGTITTSAILMFVCTTLITISSIVFGVRAKDRYWMPHPDRNYPSWSFGLFVLSGFFTTYSGMCMIVVLFNKPEVKRN